MAKSKIPQELIDKIAMMETEALLEGLEDDNLRRNPTFLEKVRKYLKDNDFKITVDEGKVKRITQEIEIPVLEDEKDILM